MMSVAEEVPVADYELPLSKAEILQSGESSVALVFSLPYSQFCVLLLPTANLNSLKGVALTVTPLL